MPIKSNIVPSENLGNIDLDSQGFRDDGSVRSALQGAKNLKSAISGIDKELASTMKDMTSYVANSEKELKALMAIVEKLGDSYKTAFQNSSIYKKASDDLKLLTNATKDYQRMVEDQNTSSRDLVSLYNKVIEAYTESANAISYMTAATWDNNESAGELRSTLRVLYQQLKDGNQLTKEQLQDLSKYLKDLDKASGTVNQRISSWANTARDTLTSLKTMFNVEQLTKNLGPSTEMQIQTQLQQRYGMSNRQFNSFKGNLYNTFDKSMYSSEAVLQTMQSLNSMGLRTEQEINKYFNKILEGQQILGMSAENQTALMQLSYKTGRDELTLGTNTYAKYLKEITNVSSAQLNQLVALNTNFVSQASNLGVDSNEFNTQNEAILGALTKASGGTELAGLYTQVLSSAMSSTDVARELFGVNSGRLNDYLNAGYDPIRLLGSSNTQAGNLFRLLSNPGSREYGLNYLSELSSGIDSSTVEFIKQVTKYQSEGVLTSDLIEHFKNLDGAAIEKELEDIKKANMTVEERQANMIANIEKQFIDWKMQDFFNNKFNAVINILGVITGLLALDNSLFGTKGLLGKAGGFASGGLKSYAAAHGTAAAVGMGALGTAGIAGGVGLGIWDASKMSYGAGLDLGDARGFFLGTGSSSQSSMSKVGSVTGNAAKYALAGAGIGTLIAPGVGTAIGAGIGGLVGGITGYIGTSLDYEKKNSDKLSEIASNTAKTVNAISVREQGRAIKSVIPYSSKVKSSSSSSKKSGGPTGGPTGIGAADSLKFAISSGYGYRDFDGWHDGIDFSGGNINGHPLYSNVTGTVVDVGQDTSGANFVGVQGSDGYIHYYWHMIAPSTREVGDHVSQGDLVGYVGSTGNSTGPHLHYQVTTARYSDGYSAFKAGTVDPFSFATDAIFSGDAAAYDPDYSPVSSSSSVSSQSLLSSISKNISQVRLANLGSSDGSLGIIDSITDLKNTIVGLSNQATANEKLMKAITSTYNTKPRMS